MKFFEMLSDFFMTPIDTIVEWLDNLTIGIGDWWSTLWHNIGVWFATTTIETVDVLIIAYMIYCCYRIIITNKDDKFSEFINKWIISGLCYFFARCGGAMILHYIGA